MHAARLLGEDAQASCLLCQREIPRAEVLTVEAQEYAYFFCGPGCYQQWEWEQQNAPDVEVDTRHLDLSRFHRPERQRPH